MQTVPDAGYQNFQKFWQTHRTQLAYCFIFNGKDEQWVQNEGLDLFSDAVSVRLEFRKEYLINLPIDVSLCVRNTSTNKIYNIFQNELLWSKTDSLGKIKLYLEQLEVENKYRLKGAIATIHAQKILEDAVLLKTENSIPHRPGDNAGLYRYMVSIVFRLEKGTALLHLKAIGQIINGAESPYDCTVSIKLQNIVNGGHYLHGYNLVNQRECEPSNLIVDITLINEANQVFWYRSGFLWLQRYSLFPSFAEGSLLSQEGCWSTFTFTAQASDQTRVDSAKIILPLN